MKTQQFNRIEKEFTFQILGGRLQLPITDPMENPDEGKQTSDEEQPATS